MRWISTNGHTGTKKAHPSVAKRCKKTETRFLASINSLIAFISKTATTTPTTKYPNSKLLPVTSMEQR
jgi:hypothetical protein